MLGRTTFPTSRLRDFCSRKELITAADVAFLEGDLIVDLLDTKVTTMGITKVVPEPDVIASAYRRACQIGTLDHASRPRPKTRQGRGRRCPTASRGDRAARGPCRPRPRLPRRASREAVGQRHRPSRGELLARRRIRSRVEPSAAAMKARRGRGRASSIPGCKSMIPGGLSADEPTASLPLSTGGPT